MIMAHDAGTGYLSKNNINRNKAVNNIMYDWTKTQSTYINEVVNYKQEIQDNDVLTFYNMVINTIMFYMR